MRSLIASQMSRRCWVHLLMLIILIFNITLSGVAVKGSRLGSVKKREFSFWANFLWRRTMKGEPRLSSRKPGHLLKAKGIMGEHRVPLWEIALGLVL